VQKSPIRILSARDVRAALPMPDAIEAMKEAFRDLSQGKALCPARTHIPAPARGGDALFMPSYLPAQDRMGIKVVTLFKNNPDKNLPLIQALMMVFDGTTGSPLALVEAGSLTALRTGAASGAATDLLAREDAKTVAIFGAGAQGRTQLEAVCAVRPVKRAWIFDRSADRRRDFEREMSKTLTIEVNDAASPEEAVSDADVICTATTSPKPVFSHAHLKPGVHINAVGSYKPEVQEIPEETVVRARVVVDHRPAALEEAGDLIAPIRQGLIKESHIHAELGEIVDRRRSGRASQEEITLFKSVGVAVQDLVAASRLLQNAKRLGLGAEFDLD
jgi:ornithine cyclodeaminase/alanine dehydrogenase-like protein (mu-crystallin family)